MLYDSTLISKDELHCIHKNHQMSCLHLVRKVNVREREKFTCQFRTSAEREMISRCASNLINFSRLHFCWRLHRGLARERTISAISDRTQSFVIYVLFTVLWSNCVTFMDAIHKNKSWKKLASTPINQDGLSNSKAENVNDFAQNRP